MVALGEVVEEMGMQKACTSVMQQFTYSCRLAL